MKKFCFVPLLLTLTAPVALANNAGGCGDGNCITGTDGSGPNDVTAGRQELFGVISATGVNNPANGTISGHIEVLDSSRSGQIDPGTGEVINGTSN